MNAAEAKQTTEKAKLELIYAAIEQAAKRAESKLNLFTHRTTNDGDTAYDFAFIYGENEIKQLKEDGFQVKEFMPKGAKVSPYLTIEW